MSAGKANGHEMETFGLTGVGLGVKGLGLGCRVSGSTCWLFVENEKMEHEMNTINRFMVIPE